MAKKRNIILIMVFSLLGCQQTDKNELISEIEKMKEDAVGFIPDPPPVIKRTSFEYNNENLKSPFKNTISIIKTKKKTLTEIEPDLERERQILEQKSLSSYYMTGVIKGEKDKKPQAIIKDLTGKVYIASVGDYIGKNHGKIQDITNNVIKLEEIVPNGPYRWVTRPTEISIIEN